MTTTYYGVYRASDGKYLPRSCTPNEKLAREIADGFTRGELVMPDGSTRAIPPVPCIVKPIR